MKSRFTIFCSECSFEHAKKFDACPECGWNRVEAEAARKRAEELAAAAAAEAARKQAEELAAAAKLNPVATRRGGHNQRTANAARMAALYMGYQANKKLNEIDDKLEEIENGGNDSFDGGGSDGGGFEGGGF